ncbi:serine hydrolase FSH, partial [Chaetomium strumarium]
IKVLCLHGMGTSAEIFRAQTAAFRARLPPNFTFTFLDGPFPCPPAPGTDRLFNSDGFYGWWTQPTVDAIRGAHLRLTDYIEEHGAVDIVMGFSQGCSLISSFLLYHARETPEQPLPFQAAVFVCGGVPLPVLEDLGVDVPQRAKDINDLTSRMMKDKAGQLVELAENLNLIKPGVGLWDDTAGLLHKPDELPDEKDVFGLDFTAMPKDVRITIPTVHVYGAKDPRWPASLQLAYLCDNRKLYDHGGGHDIPRSTEVSNKMVELLVQLSKDIRA